MNVKTVVLNSCWQILSHVLANSQLQLNRTKQLLAKLSREPIAVSLLSPLQLTKGLCQSQTHISDAQKRHSCITILLSVHAHGRTSVIPQAQTDYVICSLKSLGSPGGILLWNCYTLHDDNKLVLGPLTLFLPVKDCPSFTLNVFHAKKTLSRAVIHQIQEKCIPCIGSLSLLRPKSNHVFILRTSFSTGP